MSNIKHYNADKIISKGATINIIVGERSGGKSYQIKHKKGVEKYLNGDIDYCDKYYDIGNIVKRNVEKGKRFLLVRRLTEEIKPSKIESYFRDVDIYKLTKGKYNTVVCYTQEIYFGNYDTTKHKTVRGEKIGYVASLTTEQNFAGGSYLDVEDIIFEEFMSRKSYLYDEPTKLMNLYSTIDRKRGVVKLWLLGNTITKICPYLHDWGLKEIVENMKQGTIVEKWITTGEFDDNNIEIKVKLAIEFCEETGSTSYVIGKHKDMLNHGKWQTDPQPTLPESKKNYKTLLTIGFDYMGYKFIGEFIVNKLNHKHSCWFIYPRKKDFKKNTYVFSDIIKTSRYYQTNIYMINPKNPKLQKILDTFTENNIFYANDETGTNFKQAINFSIRR